MRPTVMAAAVMVAGLSGAAMPAPVDAAEGARGGFVSDAWASPIRVEIYEPTVPVPTEPQAEFNIAYTHTEASTGPSGQSRASWLWPGDSVGEGFHTFVEAFGLPPELGEKGYPVQVNAQSSGGRTSHADEPLPGVVMRASADQEEAVARAALSSGDGSHRDGSDEEDPGPAAPSLPSPDRQPGLLSLSPPRMAPAERGQVKTSEASPAPGLGELAAIVDASAVTSLSRSTYAGDTILATGATRLADLSLLGGLLTAESVTSVARTTSTLGKVHNEHQLRVAGLAVAGNEFTVTRKGVQPVGSQAPLPGLPDDAGQALQQLGISFALPTSTRTVDGDRGSEALRGLQVVIDTGVLRSKLDSGAAEELLRQLPDQAEELKTLLGAALQLSPRIVITLGSARSEAGVVPALDLGGSPPGSDPATDGADPSASPSAGAAGVRSGAGVSSDAGVAVPPGAVASANAADGVPTAAAALRNTAAGLPPLGSVPGMLLLGALVIAAALGWWFQKIGGLVLGAAGHCPHGLRTGLPDLRKA